MITQILAERLMNLLEDRDMTQKELAEKSNTSTSSISEWLKWENTRSLKLAVFCQSQRLSEFPWTIC